MKRFICTLILSMLALSTTVLAAEPVKSYMEVKDNRHIFTKVFELKPEEDPSLLKEDPFEQDGFSYAFFEMTEENYIHTETREEKITDTVTTIENDSSAILSMFVPEKEYNGEDGFSGILKLNHDSLVTEVEGYVAKSFTLSDSVTYVGMTDNDPAQIPKTTVKSGVTLKLKGIDWVVQDTETVDYNVIPTKYKAIASYSGSYSKNVPTGYKTTAEYIGNVEKSEVQKVIYTLTYLGEEIAVPTPSPTPEPSKEMETKDNIEFNWWIVALILGLIIIIFIVTFLLFFFNTFIYIKYEEEYKLISKRRIKWNNPVVDLTGLGLSGKEVAVKVKAVMASRLFGRQIRTVAENDFAIKCLVDKQNCDFWYVVNIPAETAE